MQQELRRCIVKLDQKDREIVLLRDGDAKDPSAFKLTKLGKAQRNFTVQGKHAIAIRRNLSSVGTQDFQSVVLQDVSQQTVVRSEIRCRAAFIAYCRMQHNAMRFAASMPGSPDEPVISVRTHSFSGDASNARVFLGSKVHNVVSETCYIHEQSSALLNDMTDGVPLLNFETSIRAVPDLQVQEDGSGCGTYAMLAKQLTSIGVPLWNRPGIDPSAASQ